MTHVTGVVNLTRHPIQLLSGNHVLARWEVTGMEARRAEFVRDRPPLLLSETTVPCVHVSYGQRLGGLPEPVPGTIYLVSRVVAAQTRRPDVFFPFGEVRDDTGQIIGCRALGQFIPDPDGSSDA